MTYKITDDCIGCGACAKKCPENAIQGEIKVHFDIDSSLCMECGTCFNTCPNGAILDPQGNCSPRKGKRKVPKSWIDPDICGGCQTCFLNCPQNAIKIIKRGLFLRAYCQVDPKSCVGCGICTKYCVTGAVKLDR